MGKLSGWCLCCLQWTFTWWKNITENKSSQAAEQLASGGGGGSRRVEGRKKLNITYNGGKENGGEEGKKHQLLSHHSFSYINPNTADGVFPKSMAFYFTCPSGKESTENIWKDEGPSWSSLEGDWTNLLSVTFRAFRFLHSQWSQLELKASYWCEGQN